MKQYNLTREEIIEQIADYQHGQNWISCLNSFTDDELNEIWDRYFADDVDEDDEEDDE